MRYLLDVNALVALSIDDHTLHSRVERWVAAAKGRSEFSLLTCPITELGAVRVLNQVYRSSIEDASATRARLKKSRPEMFRFVADDHGAEHLPAWVKTGKQTTDGPLLELAKAHNAELATLDEEIPEAFVMPDLAAGNM